MSRCRGQRRRSLPPRLPRPRFSTGPAGRDATRAGDVVGVTLFRCGRCGKRYASRRTHTCVTRLDRKRRAGKTRVRPQASLTCGTCGKPYANPLTHVCAARSDWKQRQTAARRRAAAERKRRKAAERREAAKARRQAAAARRRAVAASRRAEARRKAAEARQQARRRAAGTGGGTRQRAAEAHDYRECFHASQPDRGRAAQDCGRFLCRVYREGHENGYQVGYEAGYATGYAEGYATGHHDGYAQGFPDGISACPRPHGSG